MAVISLAGPAWAQQGCDVTMPERFRLLESLSANAGGPSYPAQTHVRAIALGSSTRGGTRAVRVRIDSAEGWVFLWPSQLRACPQGSVAQRPGDVRPTPAESDSQLPASEASAPPTPPPAPPAPPTPSEHAQEAQQALLPPPSPASVPRPASVDPVFDNIAAPDPATTLRPFAASDGQYAYFEVVATPSSAEIEVRSDDPRDRPTRLCAGRCVVQLPANRIWVFIASHGWGPFWGYGDHEMRTGGRPNTIRRVMIELRHNLWANVAMVAGLTSLVVGVIGANVDECRPNVFSGSCGTWNGLYYAGFATSLLGFIHPSNRGTLSFSQQLQAGIVIGPHGGAVSVAGQF